MSDLSGEAPRIALFDGDRRVTPWQPFSVADGTVVRVPEGSAPIEWGIVVVEARDGTRAEWPVGGVVCPGDGVGPPPQDKWLT